MPVRRRFSASPFAPPAAGGEEASVPCPVASASCPVASASRPVASGPCPVASASRPAASASCPATERPRQGALAPRTLRRLRGARGQATVELVALLPLIGLLVGLLWQALLAGETVWLSGTAARAAARAAAVGGDPLAAARAVLPARLARGLRVSRGHDGSVALVLRVPAAIGGGTLAAVTTRAGFEAQR